SRRVGSVGTGHGRESDRERPLDRSLVARDPRPGGGADGRARPRHCRFTETTFDTVRRLTDYNYAAHSRAAPARSNVRSAPERSALPKTRRFARAEVTLRARPRTSSVRRETLRPGNQTQFMHLHETRMRRHDAHAKAVSAAFRRRHCSLIDVIAVSICAASLIEDSRRSITNITIICFAVVGFHSHMLRINRAEMNPRCDLQ